jgi:hypothetical protein
MLTPRRKLFAQETSHTPLSQAQTLRTPTIIANPSIDRVPEPGFGLRLRKSFNFLCPASRVSTTRRAGTSSEVHDEALLLARTRFMDNATVAETKPSMLFQQIRRPQKASRRSLHSQTFSDGLATCTDATIVDTSVLDPMKRSFSASMRHRFMKVFGMSSNSKYSMPPQQLDASRPHFDALLDDHDDSSGFDNYHVEEEDSRRLSFYVSEHTEADEEMGHDSLTRDRNMSASHDNLQSVSSRSRVTSWANSTATTSTAGRTGGLERNRLSIIKEDGGPHQPSSSAGRHIGGITVFQDPLPTTDENGELLPPVDSQRIYSALLKRIGEEEVEMEQTRRALEEINNVQGKINVEEPQYAGKSTIRAVSSTTHGSSDAGVTNVRSDEDQDNYGNGSLTIDQHKANLERRREQIITQEAQQSFFPFSDQRKRDTRSPFRKLLDERKSQDLLRDSDDDDDTGTVLVPAASAGNKPLGRYHACLSSESIYSRTTNGGANENYRHKMESREDLRLICQREPEATGMATIIPEPVQNQQQSQDPMTAQSTANSSEREWKGWIQGQVDTLSRTESKRADHRREHAQIDCDDVDVGESASYKRPPSRNGAAQRFPLLDIKQVASHDTPVPKPTPSVTHSHSGLLKRASTMGLSSTSSALDETRKISGTLRKISPSNIARMLKERKSQILGPVETNEAGKENTPPCSDSPPMSTPGRPGLQMRRGNGRLRKRQSELEMSLKDDVTIKRSGTPGRLRALENDESPTDRLKMTLSARLSRPFNMDVPESNRPFDSTYLGKSESAAHGSRLSVAPPTTTSRPNGYGGFGSSPFDGEQDTALPDITLQQKSASGSSSKGALGGIWNSKRMVSDFLRKRRLRTLSEEKTGTASPAFI